MFSRTAALLPIAARPERPLPSFPRESTSNRSPQMTTKWASPGHSHSPANSDQALAQEAVAQGPGKHWPQMLSKMFLGSVCPRKRGNMKCERDSDSQSCVWEQLYPGPGLKLDGHSNAFRLKAVGFSHPANLTGKVPLWELCLLTLDRAGRCARPWAACSQGGRTVCSCPSHLS